MAEPLPERSYPLPSPQPSREMLEASWGLDLTPERDVKPKERLRKLKAPSSRRLKAHDGGFTDEAPALSIPQLNSTSVLCSQIQQLKLQPRDPTQHLHYSDPETEKKLPTVVKDNIAVLSDLEGVLNQRPVTEVNIPRHTTRYSNLVSVEVSDHESVVAQPCRKKTKMPVKSSTEESGPSLMEFFSSELEWEEAAWNVDTNCYASCVESLDAPNNFPSSFYSYMYQS